MLRYLHFFLEDIAQGFSVGLCLIVTKKIDQIILVTRDWYVVQEHDFSVNSFSKG